MGFARLSASFIVVFVCVSVLGAQEVQVRNCDVLLPVFDVDYSKPTVLQPVTVVGARNGVFSGRVVLASKAPIKDVRATMNDLSGAGRIAVSNVAVRYALLHAPASGLSTAFDALSNAPPNESPVATKKTFGRLWQARSPAMGWALQPVWVTVRVPKDARPGAYRGKLTITVGKKTSFKVPVDLHVSAWTLPEPHDFRTFAELVHSPESVAMFYNVPFWSDRHFELMKSSLRLMSELGSRTTYLHLLCETNQGNAESMARWVRRPDGTFTHDFTLLERYLDLVLKEMGKPQFVCV